MRRVQRGKRLAGEVGSGDRRRALVALRDKIAVQIDEGVPPRDLAALANRLQSVIAELDSMPAAKEGTPLDEVAKRRAARQADADVRPGAEGRAQRR